MLVVQPYGIGDLLFATPALRALRLVPTIEKVDLLLGSRTEEIVCANPHVDEIFTVDKSRFHSQGPTQSFKDIVALGKKLRRRCYDLLLDYSFRDEIAFYSQFFLGIPRRAGFAYKRRGFFHTHRLSIPQGFQGRHAVHYFSDLLEKTGIPVEDRHMEFYLTQAAREEAQRFLEEKWGRPPCKFLVVSPGGGESWGKDAHFKRWPVRFFSELTERLRQKGDWEGLLILGSAQEAALGEELKSQVSLPTLNLCGAVTLTQAAALLEKASLVLANDGGLVHLAHALRVPVVAFYGPVDPVVYGPYPPSEKALAVFKEGLECRPCYKAFRYNQSCEHRNCLQALSPDEVLHFLEANHFFRELCPS